MNTFRDDLLGCWVTEDESKALWIERDDDGRIRLTVRCRGIGKSPIVLREEATWTPPAPDATNDSVAARRIGYLSVPLESEGMIESYLLYVAGPNDDHDVRFDWVAVGNDMLREAVRMFPEVRREEAFDGQAMIPYADEYDHTIFYPLVTYLPATREQQEELDRALSF